MKIGIYGGSFNPIHFGHIGLAKWVIENTDLDEVWLMVSPNNPLKDKSILADEQERLEKAKKAIGENGIQKTENGKQIIVSDFEFHLPRPTYTANTLRALVQSYPEHEFTLIIGEDNVTIFDKWREHQYILDNYRVFVYPRREIESISPKEHGHVGYANDMTHPVNNIESTNLTQSEVQPTTGIIFLTGAPYFDISSTYLRKNLHS